jgi:GTP-binding protein
VQRREQLAALILIMDSRRPFTDLDIQMLEWFAPTGKPIHCILTKVDKLNRNESVNVLRQAKAKLDSYVDEDGEGFPFTVQLFSALKRIGIDEANDKILELAGVTDEQAAAQVELIEMEDDVEPDAEPKPE